MNDTIRFYNGNAESYYHSTADVDFAESYDRFLKYIPEHGSIIDIGCGSGRDAATFASRGYRAVGLDASEELAKIAERHTGIHVIVADMAGWICEKPYDGIWSCASLLHLRDNELKMFFRNLQENLKVGGAIFVSVKSGIETGIDDKGRFMRNFTKKELEDLLRIAGIEVKEQWETEDQFSRNGFSWINVIGTRR